MRRALLLALLALSACSPLPRCPSDPSYEAVAVVADVPNGRLLLFETPDARKVVSLAQPGETLWVVERRGDAVLLETDTCHRGWASARYLR